MYGINGNHKKYYKTLTINCKLIKHAKHSTVVWKHVKSDNEPDRQEANKIQVLYLYVEFDFSSKNRCCAAHPLMRPPLTLEAVGDATTTKGVEFPPLVKNHNIHIYTNK